jgi:Domain of unknown function (DUF1905)
MKYKVRNKLWLWGGGEKGSWHFVTIPPETAHKISAKFYAQKRGWGSYPVCVTILFLDGKKKTKINFKTSIFPNKRDKTFILPVKKSIRQEIGVQDGDILDLILEIAIDVSKK